MAGKEKRDANDALRHFRAVMRDPTAQKQLDAIERYLGRLRRDNSQLAERAERHDRELEAVRAKVREAEQTRAKLASVGDRQRAELFQLRRQVAYLRGTCRVQRAQLDGENLGLEAPTDWTPETLRTITHRTIMEFPQCPPPNDHDLAEFDYENWFFDRQVYLTDVAHDGSSPELLRLGLFVAWCALTWNYCTVVHPDGLYQMQQDDERRLKGNRVVSLVKWLQRWFLRSHRMGEVPFRDMVKFWSGKSHAKRPRIRHLRGKHISHDAAR